MGTFNYDLMRLLNLYYLLSVIVITWVILNYVFKNPASWVKHVINILCGVGLGYLWLKMKWEINYQSLVVTFLIATVFYEWVLKKILSQFPELDSYNNGKGLIGDIVIKTTPPVGNHEFVQENKPDIEQPVEEKPVETPLDEKVNYQRTLVVGF